jgi:ribonuclease-3
MTADGHTPLDPGVLASRLGLSFTDPALLFRALTHPSWAAERGGEHYERLEFLGDSVLGFVVADLLHKRFPDSSEGDLTQMKISLVRGGTLTDVATDLGLADALRLGRGSERSGDRTRASVLEAVFEAIVGAVYVDAGIEAARAFVVRAMGDRAEVAALDPGSHDPKTRLQELTQASGDGRPAYRIVHEQGPPQERVFTAEVSLGGTVVASGTGRSKQAAEREAAAAALAVLVSRD